MDLSWDLIMLKQILGSIPTFGGIKFHGDGPQGL